jgi:hypothetical protein
MEDGAQIATGSQASRPRSVPHEEDCRNVNIALLVQSSRAPRGAYGQDLEINQPGTNERASVRLFRCGVGA